MKRGDFLQGIIGILGVSALPKTIAVKEYKRIYLLQSFIRGFRFYDGLKILNQLKEGQILELQREPDNQYDKCAIALYYQQHKLGYVPKEDNKMLSKLIDAEVIEIISEITNLNKEAKAWENVHIAIYVRKEIKTTLPGNAAYLTVLKQPKYRSIKVNKDKVADLYFEEASASETDIMDANTFYKEMVANSNERRINDILNKDFETLENLQSAIEEGRIVINKNRLPIDLSADSLLHALHEGEIQLNEIFDEKGYVVANVNRLAGLSHRIDKVVHTADALGRKFYEINFRL